MRFALAALLAIHGLIHLIGPVHAFDLAPIPQLSAPISRAMGVVWLAASLAFLASAALVVTAPRTWWIAGAIAVALSQVAIVASWSDARFGTIANVGVAIAVIVGAASYGPTSLWSEYRRDVSQRVALLAPAPLVTEADLARLPAPARRFLARAGVVGRPRAHHYRAVWRGRIRSGPDAAWMPLRAEQHNVVSPPARMFFMEATMMGAPIDGYHRYADEAATMRVRAAGLVPVTRASGEALTETETVTLLNDMCMLAPATLLGPEVHWATGSDERSARVSLTVGRHTVSADLSFDDAGDLVDFVSQDRSELRNGALVKRPWSTPLTGHRSFGALRAAAHGQALWHEAAGTYAYIELELLELDVT